MIILKRLHIAILIAAFILGGVVASLNRDFDGYAPVLFFEIVAVVVVIIAKRNENKF
jgi:hypothetical protein